MHLYGNISATLCCDALRIGLGIYSDRNSWVGETVRLLPSMTSDTIDNRAGTSVESESHASHMLRARAEFCPLSFI